MQADRIFSLMSSATLASFIADIEALGTGADREDLLAGSLAGTALVNLVGEAEAKRLIDGCFPAPTEDTERLDAAAAAPELLQACKALLAYDEHTEDALDHLEKTVALARAAVAKAERKA